MKLILPHRYMQSRDELSAFQIKPHRIINRMDGTILSCLLKEGTLQDDESAAVALRWNMISFVLLEDGKLQSGGSIPGKSPNIVSDYEGANSRYIRELLAW